MKEKRQKEKGAAEIDIRERFVEETYSCTQVKMETLQSRSWSHENSPMIEKHGEGILSAM